MLNGIDVSKIAPLFKMMNGNVNPTEILKMMGGANNQQANQLMQLLPLLTNSGNLNGLINGLGGNNKGKPNNDLPQKDDFAYALYKLSES